MQLNGITARDNEREKMKRGGGGGGELKLSLENHQGNSSPPISRSKKGHEKKPLPSRGKDPLFCSPFNSVVRSMGPSNTCSLERIQNRLERTRLYMLSTHKATS